MILVNRKECPWIIGAASMSAIASRLVGTFELDPLSVTESSIYLHAKLKDSGIESPDEVMPIDICEILHHASGGRPGLLDAMAERTIRRADTVPLNRDDLHIFAPPDVPASAADAEEKEQAMESKKPTLYVSLNGKTLEDLELENSKLLIGRSKLSDICIDNEFVSKHHALLRFDNNVMHVVDLKSKNGTYINSRRVRCAQVRNNDIISIGDYRLKYVCGTAATAADAKENGTPDTVTMKIQLERRLQAAKADTHTAHATK